MGFEVLAEEGLGGELESAVFDTYPGLEEAVGLEFVVDPVGWVAGLAGGWRGVGLGERTAAGEEVGGREGAVEEGATVGLQVSKHMLSCGKSAQARFGCGGLGHGICIPSPPHAQGRLLPLVF